MSYAAYKLSHAPTGVENSCSAFLTHSAGSSAQTPGIPITLDDGVLLQNGGSKSPPLPNLPNLIISKGNVLEVYRVRVEEADPKSSKATGGSAPPSAARRGGAMAGISSAWLELVCHHRLHGNVESMTVLHHGRDDGRKRRDAIILAFREAKLSVLEFDDSTHSLRTSSMHYFEGPDWQYLKRGAEKFPRGPLLRGDPQGRCAGALVYDTQMIMLKAEQEGYGFGEEEEGMERTGALCAHVKSSYVVSMRELGVIHIKDFTFLHGYIEPVLLLLHEKEPTWAGHAAVKRHTCVITALSINTTLKQHPLIWSTANLPYDAYMLLAVPSPIGGVIVVAANSIHYHSQSTTCSLGLNDYATWPEGSGDMPKSKISVELDAARVTWISHDIALFSTKTGMLLLLSLIYDGRTVQKLELMKSRASVLTSCMSMLGDMFFFLGSRLGDSLFVQFTCGSNAEQGDSEADAAMPPAKRLHRMTYEDSQDGVGMEELSLYHSSSANTDLLQKNFNFLVRDSFINIGPVRDFAHGLRMNADPNASGAAKQSNYELVCCSGHGKNGSLSILHQSLRPDLITEVELPGCKGIWTVYYKGSRSLMPDTSGSGSNADEEFHAYLIISLESRTMVLETGDTLGEVTETVDYYTEGPTIVAGNLFNRKRVVQVFSRGVRLLDGAYMTQELRIEAPSSKVDGISKSDSVFVAYASIVDPYVLLKMTDGTLQLVTGDPTSCNISVTAPSMFQTSGDPVTACSLYQDRGPSPWLRRTSMDAWLAPSFDLVDISDGSDTNQGDVYCVICKRSGRLELYELPNLICVFSVNEFAHGHRFLFDTRAPSRIFMEGLQKEGVETQNQDATKQDPSASLHVLEVCMEKWSDKFGRPFLLAVLSDGTSLCYHAYLYEGTDNNLVIEEGSEPETNVLGNVTSRLKNLRFVRLALDRASGEEDVATLRPSIVLFRNVSGLRGAFVTGSRPVWLMNFRERLQVHPQLCDGAIVAFTPLHNINCNHGLIYVTSQGLLKICQLPALNYDNDWAAYKIPLKGTPHQITYHADANLYAVIVSSTVQKPAAHIIESADQGTAFITELENEDGQRMVNLEEFEIRIIEAGKAGSVWDTRTVLPMQMTEHALTVRIVNLKGPEQMQTLLAIGTAYVQGEDVPSRGRIILMSLGQEANDSSRWATEVFSKECKQGAVTAIASLQGHLLIAIGTKIFLHSWNGTDLEGTAFYDAPLYVMSLNIVKNFVLFGDIHKSIYFLCWKEDGAQLVLLAKDFGSLDCYATEFLIDGSTLSLLVSDSRKNIQIFSYSPKSVESWKGQKLLPRAEFHVGAHISKFARLPMLPTTSSTRTNRYALLFGSLDGSMGCIAPLDELGFRRLQSLQKKLVDAVSHVAGLNPRSFRQFKACGQTHRPGPDNIVDCELLFHYEMLALKEQLELAHQIGTTRSQILSNLSDLTLSTGFL